MCKKCQSHTCVWENETSKQQVTESFRKIIMFFFYGKDSSYRKKSTVSFQYQSDYFRNLGGCGKTITERMSLAILRNATHFNSYF